MSVKSLRPWNGQTDTSIVAGEAFVRELDVSKITLRIKEKQDKKGDEHNDHTIAKLVGGTLDTLQRCLVRPARRDPGHGTTADTT